MQMGSLAARQILERRESRCAEIAKLHSEPHLLETRAVTA
jgi:methyl coenzyme M reductase gamma subunit